ncbi:hypothetical protein MVEN_01797500 [Mycena venus]|uniref:Uncharacterized protein n=1 Tax=Mycena venus TaxID=2733690 RepID=A0A8H7CN61_9AGAR|nr:hypothetical protein MVEN_01797500 [Mycena venus]
MVLATSMMRTLLPRSLGLFSYLALFILAVFSPLLWHIILGTVGIESRVFEGCECPENSEQGGKGAQAEGMDEEQIIVGASSVAGPSIGAPPAYQGDQESYPLLSKSGTEEEEETEIGPL